MCVIFYVFLLIFYFFIDILKDMNEVDFLVIGAGPAGLSGAFYASRGGLRVCVLEGGQGSQVMQIKDLENFPGVLPAINGFDLIDTIKKQALAFGVEFILESAESIEKKEDFFFVKTSSHEFKARSVLFATGATHRMAGVKGEKEFFGRGVSYCAVCDGPFFRGKDIVVIGGGDSAISEALFLSKIAKQVTIVHRRNTLRAQKALTEQASQTENVVMKLGYTVLEICGGDENKNRGAVNSVVLAEVETGKNEIVSCDAVFVFVGMEPVSSLVGFLQKDENGYIITDENMATSIPGLFCAGDVRSKPLRQIITACSDGAIAAFSAGKYIEKLS